MVKGFDFDISQEGELLLDAETHDIAAVNKNDLRLQLAYDRIKSVTTTWLYDEVGANLEMLIGKPCNQDTAKTGKNLITEQLTFDGLWEDSEIYIQAEIDSYIHLIFYVFFKIYDENTDDTYSEEIIAELDLIKGVNVRYGWEPKL